MQNQDSVRTPTAFAVGDPVYISWRLEQTLILEREREPSTVAERLLTEADSPRDDGALPAS